jgi:uncharacterized phiE125 gp8 family phage protein
MALILITPPDIEPVTLTEAKTHLRVDISTDDTLISTYIAVARDYVERTCRPRLALLTQTWRYISDEWPESDTIELRPYPLQSVVSITYTNSAGVTATFPSASYLVDTSSEPGRVRLKAAASWPSTTLQEINGLAIEFDAGFGDAGSDVPTPLRQAILMLVGHWYENREPMLTTGVFGSQLEFAVKALVAPWRREV